MGHTLFIFQFNLALVLFVLGVFSGYRFLSGAKGADLKDMILSLLLLDNAIGVCIWIYLTV